MNLKMFTVAFDEGYPVTLRHTAATFNIERCGIYCLLFVFQAAIQIKEFGVVTKIDFSPLPPHNYAVTASTRVSLLISPSHTSYLHLFIFQILSSKYILKYISQEMYSVVTDSSVQH